MILIGIIIFIAWFLYKVSQPVEHVAIKIEQPKKDYNIPQWIGTSWGVCKKCREENYTSHDHYCYKCWNWR